MPYFSVLVEGSGFKIPSSSGQPPVTGFAVSRVVRAREASADLEHSIDLCADKLARQVKRHREKLRGRREGAPGRAAEATP